MNKETSSIVKIFNRTAAMFLACALIWCIESLVFNAPEAFDTVRLIASFFFAGLLIACFQFAWFTDKFIKKMSYTLRAVVFGICIYASLVPCILIGCWFPIDNLAAWIGFTIAIIIMTASISISFHIYFKRTVGSYKAALEAYHDKTKQQ